MPLAPMKTIIYILPRYIDPTKIIKWEELKLFFFKNNREIFQFNFLFLLLFFQYYFYKKIFFVLEFPNLLTFLIYHPTHLL